MTTCEPSSDDPPLNALVTIMPTTTSTTASPPPSPANTNGLIFFAFGAADAPDPPRFGPRRPRRRVQDGVEIQSAGTRSGSHADRRHRFGNRRAAGRQPRPIADTPVGPRETIRWRQNLSDRTEGARLQRFIERRSVFAPAAAVAALPRRRAVHATASPPVRHIVAAASCAAAYCAAE